MVESCHARRDARPTYLVTIGHPGEYQSDPFLSDYYCQMHCQWIACLVSVDVRMIPGGPGCGLQLSDI